VRAFWNAKLREPLRRLLIRLLSWTEKGAAPAAGGPRSRTISLWKRDIHVPVWLVALVVSVFLFLVLLLEIGAGWSNAAAMFLFTAALAGLFIFYFKHDQPHMLHDDEAVALLGVLMVGGVGLIELWTGAAARFSWLAPHGVPLAAAPILTSILLSPRLAVIVTMALALILGMIQGFSLEAALIASFGGLAGVARSLFVSARRDLTRAGLWAAAGHAVAVMIPALLQHWQWRQTGHALLWAGVSGAAAGLLALSLLSPLENFFSRLSNIKLLELSDVNHPLLKRMSLEAPGTYHHSLIMASLAEAAAQAIGAKGLLCRVGAYFHDIGKMVKPEYFVENQGALGNPHDPLPANMSRLVIQSHVKDGLALARQHNLDRAVAEFIPMHHGTSRIEYFYRRAIEQNAGGEEVGEEEYRYPGPRPHSKETAIVMLADSIEASARALEEPTHQRLRDLVQKVVSTKLADGQFDEVPLTLSDLHKISESFVNTLTGVYHSRVRYPDASSPASSQA
jgi:cyclic-di-AMP phosphodiesterase PgpH